MKKNVKYSSNLLDLKIAISRLMTNLVLEVHKLSQSTKLLKIFESLYSYSSFKPDHQINLYLEFLKRLRNSVGQRRFDLWWTKDWWFHNDHVFIHTDIIVRQSLAKKYIVLRHPLLTHLTFFLLTFAYFYA